MENVLQSNSDFLFLEYFDVIERFRRENIESQMDRYHEFERIPNYVSAYSSLENLIIGNGEEEREG